MTAVRRSIHRPLVLVALAMSVACNGGGTSGASAGSKTASSGKDAPAKQDPTTAAKAEGGDAKAEGGDAKAEGGDAKAEGGDAKAEGGDAKAEGGDAKAEGGDAKAEGGDAKAEGGDAKAEGGDAKAEGGDATAEGGEAGAEGGTPAADPAALTKEIKSKKTKDERATAALAELEASGAKLRDVAKAANARGEALFEDPDRAKTFFEWAAAKDPKYPDPIFNLAKQTANVGDVEATRAYLVQVKERGGKKLLSQIDFDPMWEIVKDDPEVRKLLGG